MMTDHPFREAVQEGLSPITAPGGDERDDDIELGSCSESRQYRQRRGSLFGLVPRDGRRRDSGQLGQQGLGEPGLSA